MDPGFVIRGDVHLEIIGTTTNLHLVFTMESDEIKRWYLFIICRLSILNDVLLNGTVAIEIHVYYNCKF